MLGPGASWQGGPGGTHRVGRSILSHGRSVSIIVEHNCWVEEQSQTFHPTWGGGTAADLFLFTEHALCPQSRLTALPGLPVSITENDSNGP